MYHSVSEEMGPAARVQGGHSEGRAMGAGQLVHIKLSAGKSTHPCFTHYLTLLAFLQISGISKFNKMISGIVPC